MTLLSSEEGRAKMLKAIALTALLGEVLAVLLILDRGPLLDIGVYREYAVLLLMLFLSTGAAHAEAMEYHQDRSVLRSMWYAYSEMWKYTPYAILITVGGLLLGQPYGPPIAVLAGLAIAPFALIQTYKKLKDLQAEWAAR